MALKCNNSFKGLIKISNSNSIVLTKVHKMHKNKAFMQTLNEELLTNIQTIKNF